jgi:SAM-dependent methyltransferase
MSLPHILSVLDLTPSDVLYDLGAGDGRVCLAAAEGGQGGVGGAGVRRAVGVEIEPDVCDAFEKAIEQRGLADRVRCVRGDLRDVDLSDATAVVLNLLPEGVEAVQEKLMKLLREKRGVRVLCNTWGFKGVKASKRVDVAGLTFLVYRSEDFEVAAAAEVDEVDVTAEPLTQPGRPVFLVNPPSCEAEVKGYIDTCRRLNGP